MSDAPHLLVVDDDREIRDLLQRFLTRHGYRVDVAGDGRAMQRLLDHGRFALVVLDLMLPGEDGLAVARSVARGHGGDVLLEDRPGGGLVASLRLPASRGLAGGPGSGSIGG
jgi:two-component system OmpR family response regulator